MVDTNGATYKGGQTVIRFDVGPNGSLLKDIPIRLSIAGLQTPSSKTSTTTAKIRTYKAGSSLNNAFQVESGVLDQGEYMLPAIEPRDSTATSSGTAGATSSGTASDGTTS